MPKKEKWFEDAKNSLENDLDKNENIDGVRFLSEYLDRNWPDDLDNSVNEEQFEAYINEHLDDFESWLIESHPDIGVHGDYTWGISTSATRSVDSGDPFF